MGYVAVKGGERAILNAEKLFQYLCNLGSKSKISETHLSRELYILVDRLMSEAGVYSTRLAALALKQTGGDLFESTLILRAFKNTVDRIGYTAPIDTSKMRVIRRISAAFKDIPGGQILGPTLDYSLRLFRFDYLMKDPSEIERDLLEQYESIQKGDTDNFEDPIKLLRREGIVVERPVGQSLEFVDITMEVPSFPPPRSAILQSLARAETGGLLLLAYSNVRGYGDVHPTVGELRVGYVEVCLPQTETLSMVIGEIKVTEAKIICKIEDKEGEPKFGLGYGLCFGHNETKAIAMAILDRALQEGGIHPSQNVEFVLSHTDCLESSGFVLHFKLPHYVTFQSDLDRLRRMKGV